MKTATLSGPPSPPVPGQPHPDVALVVSLFREMNPGDTVKYSRVAAAIATADPAIIRRRSVAARRQLVQDGFDIVAVPAVGVHRNTAAETLARHEGRERRGIQRKAGKAAKALGTIDVAELSPDERFAFYAARTITNVIYAASGKTAGQKVLAAVKATEALLPMAKALEILRNGS